MSWRLPLAAVAIAACTGPEPGVPPNLVVVHVRDFAFEAPDTIPAGLTAIQMINSGPSAHHVQLYLLPATLTPAAAMALLPPKEPLLAEFLAVGGPEGADDPSRPVTTIMKLRPGSYLLICRFTEAGRLHYTMGMARPLTVIESPADTATIALVARDTIALQDFTFWAPDSVAAGQDTFFVVNRGPHEHHVAIARLLPGKTVQDVILELATPGAPAAAEVLGGTAGLGVGESNLLPIPLTPGRHVLLCFVTDPVTGREHAAMGMVRGLVVYPSN